MPRTIDNAVAPFASLHRLDRLRAIDASNVVSSVTKSSTWVVLGTIALQAASDDVSRTSLDLLARILEGTKK